MNRKVYHKKSFSRETVRVIVKVIFYFKTQEYEEEEKCLSPEASRECPFKACRFRYILKLDNMNRKGPSLSILEIWMR
jgi:hypothetical protein